MNEKMTRGEFLRSLTLMGIGAASFSALISSCSGGGDESSSQTASRPKQSRPKPSTSTATNDPCADVSGLTDTELKMRNETLSYVAESPDPAKLCDNCKFWIVPEGGSPCGGCELIKGPIHPKGYCTSWFTAEEA